MIAPINCPKCDGPLLNVFEDKKRVEYLIKECKNVSHVFWCKVYFDTVIGLTISLNGKMRAEWIFNDQPSLRVYHVDDMAKDGSYLLDCVNLPWFEPDITNIKALVKKLNKYIALS